jgi:hypothetical protein
MWYDREYIVRHIGEIGILWVHFLLLMPPVSYVWYPKLTANLYWVGVVLSEIWINFLQVLWWFRMQIQIKPGGGR